MKTVYQTVCNALKHYSSFLVTTHVSPDGDAIGSLLGMGRILSALGKKYVLYTYSDIPERFSWLPHANEIRFEIPSQLPECCILLDCGDFGRAGVDIQSSLRKMKTINIDHHISNPKTATYNLVEPNRAATGEILAYIAKFLDIPLKNSLAEYLYMAIVTDTGSFSYSSTSSELLNLVGELINNGLNIGIFQSHLKRQTKLNQLKLQGLALDTIELNCDNLVASIMITQKMLNSMNAKSEDCEGLIDIIRTIKGTYVAVSLRETKIKNQIKFSLRSWGEVDVQAIASKHNGGGHHNAAGGTINEPIENAKIILLSTISEQLKISNL